MLTKKLACPSCQVHLKIADTLPPGKLIKCPKCGENFPVPDDNETPLQIRDQTPSAEPASPNAAVAKRRKAIALPHDDQESDDEAKVRRISPKRRKRRKKTASNTPLILGLALGGAVLAIGAGVALLFVFKPAAHKELAVAENNPPTSGPRLPPARTGNPEPAGPRPAIDRTEPAGSKPAVRSETPAPGRVGGESDQAGVALTVFEANCARCHSLGNGTASRGRTGRGRGPDLSRVGARRSAAWLLEHIRNPTSHNANAKMPAFEGKIEDNDVRSLAEYLASLK